MAVRGLPGEVWLVVLGFLRNPIPPPRSGLTDRSLIAQPHLCQASRVCKLFKAISNELLYTYLVTSDLPSLLHDVRQVSKRRLLAHTRSLHVEYTVKGEHPTYRYLMSGAYRWKNYGIISEEGKEAVRQEDCDKEIAKMLHCLQALLEVGMKSAFPKLETLVISSICHKEDGVWHRHRVSRLNPNVRAPLARCNDLFERVIASGSIRQMCIRDPSGPLSIIVEAQHKFSSSPHFLRTIHFDAADMLILPMSFGRPTRWVSEIPSHEAWVHAIHKVGSSLASTTYFPKNANNPLDIDLEIYCSTNHYGPMPNIPNLHLERDGFAQGIFGAPSMPLHIRGPVLSLGEQQTMADELAAQVVQYYREERGRKDSIRWYPSALTPTCTSCGSGPPA